MGSKTATTGRISEDASRGSEVPENSLGEVALGVASGVCVTSRALGGGAETAQEVGEKERRRQSLSGVRRSAGLAEGLLKLFAHSVRLVQSLFYPI